MRACQWTLSIGPNWPTSERKLNVNLLYTHLVRHEQNSALKQHTKIYFAIWESSIKICFVTAVLFIFQYISNKMQRYTVYFIWKLIYLFRVVTPPIIRSANSCVYSIWYLSHRYCYLPLSWKSWNCSAKWGAKQCLRATLWIYIYIYIYIVYSY